VSSLYFFFFSSRRRHTRFSRDWSSDVCSSDLRLLAGSGSKIVPGTNFPEKRAWHEFSGLERGALRLFDRRLAALLRQQLRADLRSEERRVGNECTSRRALEQDKGMKSSSR